MLDFLKYAFLDGVKHSPFHDTEILKEKLDSFQLHLEIFARLCHQISQTSYGDSAALHLKLGELSFNSDKDPLRFLQAVTEMPGPETFEMDSQAAKPEERIAPVFVFRAQNLLTSFMLLPPSFHTQVKAHLPEADAVLDKIRTSLFPAGEPGLTTEPA